MSNGAPATAEQRPGSEHSAQAGPASRADDNYWPMFWGSVQAALLTVTGEFVFTIYIALQRGIGVELRLWHKVLPYMAMETQRPVFESVIRWASISTAVTLAIFSVAAFVSRRRLQTQAGRAFAWLDMALIGALNLSRAWWFDDSLSPSTWMYALVLIGLVGLAVSMTIVNIDYNEREARGEAEPDVEFVPVASSAPAAS